MRSPPQKKSKTSDKPKRELARGSATATSAGEVTPGPSDRPAPRRDATRGEAKSGGDARRYKHAHDIPGYTHGYSANRELDEARGLQSPPKESSSGSDNASSSSDSKGSNSPDDGHEAPGEEGEKGSPNSSPGGASPVANDLFFGDSDEGQKPAAREIGPLHEGRGADHNPSYEEALNKLPAHMLKDPPATASVAQAAKATGNKPAQTPGRTPRVQPPTLVNPPSVARRIPVMLLDHEEQQVLDDDSEDSEDGAGTRMFFRDLREVVGLLTILLIDGLTSPLRLYQTAEPELDKLFKANPEFGARDRTRLKCFRTLLLNVLPLDLKEREGIPTRELLEEALNRASRAGTSRSGGQERAQARSYLGTSTGQLTHRPPARHVRR
jgi:hypothetical protein